MVVQKMAAAPVTVNGKPHTEDCTKHLWNVVAPPAIFKSTNPIRATLASVTATPPHTSKPLIDLGLGDPTAYPLHSPPPSAALAIQKTVMSQGANGYLHGAGSLTARTAVAHYHEQWDGVRYGVDSVVLTHGVSHALEMALSVLVAPRTPHHHPNVLIPRPGFPLYKAQLLGMGAEVREYDCVEEQGWSVDLACLDKSCDLNTVAIIVTNPSNPCGSNFSREHLEDILDIAGRHKIPIIADEIYGHMTWGSSFVPLARLSSEVPIITLSGLSKRFLLPGWRFGWVALHDPSNNAPQVKEALNILANRILGPNSLVQASVAEILSTPNEWFEEVVEKIEINARIAVQFINHIPGLSASAPHGALYMMVRIDLPTFGDAFNSDVDFSAALYVEEAILVLPGRCFSARNHFRIVLASSVSTLEEVGRRLRSFCERHSISGEV